MTFLHRFSALRRTLLPVLFLALGALFSVRAWAGIPIQHWTTAAGARVYFIESHVLPIVDVNISFAAGGAYDPKGKAALSALTQGLLDAGAGDLDEEQIAEAVANLGADLSGDGDTDRVTMSLRTLADKPVRDKAVGILRTVLQAPRFPADILDREKNRLIAAIRESETRPDAIAGRRFAELMYPNHPYGVQQSVASVSAIQRDDLVAFYRGHYNAKRAVVAIVGDMSRSDAEAIARQLTDGLPPVAGDAGDAAIPTVMQPKQQVLRLPHPAAQSHILLGMPGLARQDADYFPLLVGNYILGGGGFVSRLTKEVREKKGYAYDVHSYFLPLQQPGPFQIGLQTKRSQSGEALKLVNSVLADFLAHGPTEAEVRAAKRNLVDGFALRIDSNKKLLEYLAVIGFYQLPLDWLEHYPKAVEKVTAAQIKDAYARRIKPEHLVTVVVAGGEEAAPKNEAGAAKP